MVQQDLYSISKSDKGEKKPIKEASSSDFSYLNFIQKIEKRGKVDATRGAGETENSGLLISDWTVTQNQIMWKPPSTQQCFPIKHNWTYWRDEYFNKSKRWNANVPPFILVCSDAAINDFLHLRNGYLVKTAWLHSLYRPNDQQWRQITFGKMTQTNTLYNSFKGRKNLQGFSE